MGHSKKVTVMVGFVPIATRIEVAVDEESSGTHGVCIGTEEKPHAPARVRQSVGCTDPECDIVHSSVFPYRRGIERDGELVVLTREEIAAANGSPRTGRATEPPIELAFHPREKVYAATVAADSVQNIYPDKGGEKAYVVLRDTLRAHPEIVAVMVWAPSSKNALWVLEVVDNRIVASKRCWPEQVRPTMEIPTVEVPEQERDMFDLLIQTKVEDFDLLTYVDESKRSLQELIASRAGSPLPVAGTSPSAAAIPSMIAALEASLEAAKARITTANAPVKRAPAKKAVAKKAPAKKAAAPRKRTATKRAAVPLPKAG